MAGTRRPGQALLDLVAEEDARGNGVDEPEGLPGVALALAVQGPRRLLMSTTTVDSPV
jgi:hypothetical protein